MPMINGLWVPWKSQIEIRHLLDDIITEFEVPQTMRKIGMILRGAPSFAGFPDRDKFLTVDRPGESNELLDAMYDYADKHLIEIQ